MGSQVHEIPVDSYRRGNRIHLHFDLPGVKPEDIELSVDRGTVTVRAERSYEEHEGDKLYVHDRPQGTFEAQVSVPEMPDDAEVVADCVHGVLSVMIRP